MINGYMRLVLAVSEPRNAQWGLMQSYINKDSIEVDYLLDTRNHAACNQRPRDLSKQKHGHTTKLRVLHLAFAFRN